MVVLCVVYGQLLKAVKASKAVLVPFLEKWASPERERGFRVPLARVPSPPNVHVTYSHIVTAMVLVTHLQATHEWHTLFFFCVDIQTGPHSLTHSLALVHISTSSLFNLDSTANYTFNKQQLIQQQTQTPASMFSTYPGQVVVDHPVKVPIEHRFDPYVDNGG